MIEPMDIKSRHVLAQIEALGGVEATDMPEKLTADGVYQRVIADAGHGRFRYTIKGNKLRRQMLAELAPNREPLAGPVVDVRCSGAATLVDLGRWRVVGYVGGLVVIQRLGITIAVPAHYCTEVDSTCL